jgi:16S rRNA (adenine1518-N6/adenine1519-N6)-dimethyltransferase
VFAVVDAAFAHRRKQIRPALRELAGSAEAATAALEHAGIDPTVRGEMLVVDDFARIAEGLRAVSSLVEEGALRPSRDPGTE